MTLEKPNISLIGFGKIGSAITNGWIKNNVAKSITTIDPHNQITNNKKTDTTIESFKNISECTDTIKKSDFIILAVKPQIMGLICKEIKPYINKNTTLISIAAGKTIGYFENHFTKSQEIIRTMPNTPSSIGKGITAAIANNQVSKSKKEQCNILLESIGDIVWVDDEKLMDPITALSGSGPAYIFLLIETLTNCGTRQGIPEEIAEKLARQTVIGSAALAESSPETKASILRQNVTSPNGTTEAALNVLMTDNKLENILDKAITSATMRSKELSD